MIDFLLPPFDFPKPAIIRPAPAELLRYGGDPVAVAMEQRQRRQGQVVGGPKATAKKSRGPEFVDFTSDVARSATLDLDIPAGNAGDLLLLFLGRPRDGNTPVSFSTPSGWTSLYDVLPTSRFRAQVLAKFADGSEGSSLAIASTGSSSVTVGIMVRYSGVSAYYHNNTTGSSSAPNSPSLTPGSGVVPAIWLTVQLSGDRTGSAYTSSVPTSYGLVADEYDGYAPASFVNSRVSVASRDDLTATSEDPGAWSLSSSRPWSAVTIGLA